jgi:hypothetical protein
MKWLAEKVKARKQKKNMKINTIDVKNQYNLIGFKIL